MNRAERRAGGQTAAARDSALQDRLHLFQHNAQAARMAWTQGGADPDHVVLIADATDAIGGPLARAQMGDAYAAEIAAFRRRGVRPTAVASMPRAACAAGLVEISPGVAAQLGVPPPDGFVYAIVSCSGGTTLTFIAAEPLAMQGSA